MEESGKKAMKTKAAVNKALPNPHNRGGKMKRLAYSAIGILAFMFVWDLATRFTLLGRLMPGPLTVLAQFFRNFVVPIGRYTMTGHILISMKRVMIGYLAGVLLGIACGLGMGTSRLFRAIFRPLFELLRPIPTIAWIPMAILWFGVDEMTKYFIIFYGAFTTVTLNTFAGVQQVDPVLIGAAKMLGAKDNQILWKVILPSAIPNIAAGMQVGLSAGWMGLIAAEMVRSKEGLGWIVIMGQETANMTQILAGMIAIAVMGLLLATLMRYVEKELCIWNTRQT